MFCESKQNPAQMDFNKLKYLHIISGNMLKKIKKDMTSLFKDKTFRKVLIIFIISKVIVLSAAYAAQFLPDVQHRKIRTDNIYLNGWAQYDAGGYLDIAENGYRLDYNNGMGNYSLYPFYPLLIKVLWFVGYPLAAFLISNIASFFAIIVMYMLVKDELGKKTSYRTLFYILLFPTAYFFTAMYTESLFLLLAVSMFFFAKKEQWLYVGILGFCISLTRIQGFLMFFPMIYVYLRSKNFSLKKIDHKSLYLLLIPLGVAVFFLYEYTLTGDLFIQFKEFSTFNKQVAYPWITLYETVAAIMGGSLYNLINFTAFLTLIALLLISLNYLKKEYAIYLFFNISFIILSSNLNGIGRYTLTMFPAFMTLGAVSNVNRKFRWFTYFIYILFIFLLILFTLRHVNEGIYLTVQTF